MVRVIRAAFRWVVLVTALAAVPALAGAQTIEGDDSADKTLSPYFFVRGAPPLRSRSDWPA